MRDVKGGLYIALFSCLYSMFLCMVCAAIAGRVLGSEPTPDAPLMEAGLDSLAAVELRNSASEAFNLSLPATVVFDHPTLAALSADVVRRLQAALASKGATPPHPPPPPINNISSFPSSICIKMTTWDVRLLACFFTSDAGTYLRDEILGAPSALVYHSGVGTADAFVLAKLN